MFKKILVGLSVVGLVLGFGSIAYALPGDWSGQYRNADDSEYIPLTIPTRATSSYSVLGGVPASDEAMWYYFNPAQFSFSLSSNSPYSGSKVQISINEGIIDVGDIGGLDDVLAGKVSTSTYNSGIASLQGQITTLFSGGGSGFNMTTFMSTSASTTPYVATTTTSAPSLSAFFIPGWMVNKVNGMATTTDWAAITNKPTFGAVATTSSYTDLTNKPTIGKAYEGTTLRTGAFPLFLSATVSSGTAVVHLTDTGLSGGNALCGTVIQDSVSVIFNDSGSSFQQSWAWSNSNKTLTVTANKFTTANILSGILGQAAANASVAKITVWCY